MSKIEISKPSGCFSFGTDVILCSDGVQNTKREGFIRGEIKTDYPEKKYIVTWKDGVSDSVWEHRLQIKNKNY